MPDPDASLSDEILSPGARAAEPGPDEAAGDPGTDTAGPARASRAAVDFQDDDDEFEPETRRRSRVTTVLLVALIFMVGVLVGVLVGKVLSPAPAAQVVYVLSDPGSASPQAPLPSASPSASR